MKLAGVDCGKLAKSFAWAAKGVRHVIATEQNMRLHCVTAAGVLSAAAFFRVSVVEWCLLVLSIALVMAAECVNSAVERLADRVSMEEHFLIQHAKDASAGGVLVVSVGTAVVGAAIFLPRFWALLFP